MITTAAHLIAYIATLFAASALLLLSYLIASFNESLTKLTMFGAISGNEYVSIFVISIICYLIFMVIFSGVDKEDGSVERLTKSALIATIAFVCFVFAAITLKMVIL